MRETDELPPASLDPGAPGRSAAAAAERRAVARWRPARRWYHPILARMVIASSRTITSRLSTLSIDGIDRFERCRDRDRRGLLTIANHVSMFDDPLVTASFSPSRYEDIRWVASDALNFFGSPWKAWIFTAGKCVPVVRGGGVGQDAMAFLIERLRGGEWAHIFPEGGRTRDPRGLMQPVYKPGVGRLIAEAHPIVLPFYHHGMRDVLPVGALRPRRGKHIRLVFGEPVDCNEAFIDAVLQASGARRAELAGWMALAAWAHGQLSALERMVHPDALEARP